MKLVAEAALYAKGQGHRGQKPHGGYADARTEDSVNTVLLRMFYRGDYYP